MFSDSPNYTSDSMQFVVFMCSGVIFVCLSVCFVFKCLKHANPFCNALSPNVFVKGGICMISVIYIDSQ